MASISADIKYVEDKQGNVFFPVAHENGVVDNDGTILSTKLASYVTNDVLERLTTTEITNLLNI